MENGVEVLRDIEWTEYGQTVLHPLSFTLLLVMCFLVLFNDKKYIMIPFLIIGAFITSMQRIVLGTLDFSLMRLLMLTAFFRIIICNEHSRLAKEKIDKLMIVYVVVLSLAYIALYKTGSAFANRMGFALETLLAFFIIRFHLKSIEQLVLYLKVLSLVFLLMALFMTVEQFTQYNIFSIFGGIPEFTMMREGRLRAQGAFSHPIMAGTFGAVFFPVFWGLLNIGNGTDKKFAVLGMFSSFIIVWASSSSGPVLALLAGIGAITFWKLRDYSKYIMPVIITCFILLQIVMKAPAWHLIARIDVVGGSTGYHRFALIDAAISNFSEWAILGVKTTGHWGWGLNDVTNMFILQAVRGGMGALILFIIMVAAAFNLVGKARRIKNLNLGTQKFVWAWGCVLFAHVVSFFGVSYFGQMDYFWIQTLAIIACLPSIDYNYITNNEMSSALIKADGTA